MYIYNIRFSCNSERDFLSSASFLFLRIEYSRDIQDFLSANDGFASKRQ